MDKMREAFEQWASKHARSIDPDECEYAWSAWEAAWQAATAQCAPEGWQSIDTAPKDGTVVILWSDADVRFDNNGNGGRWLGSFAVGVWVSTIPILDEWNDGGGGLILNPTHWMPFPATPEPGE